MRVFRKVCCSYCCGDGFWHGEECPECGGTGEAYIEITSGYAPDLLIPKECPECSNGCEFCDGMGKIYLLT